MKEDLNRPLYADYRKQQALRFFWNFSITSGEKSYELADMPLVVIGRILIVLAIGVMGRLNPYSRYCTFETVIICLILFIIGTSFYKYKFAYRFGRFRVTWEDKELHSDAEASSRCDKDGKFLKTEENRIAAKKSRFAFSGLYAGIIAAVLLYCFLWIGLSYTRVPSWHSKEIEEAWQIAQKYDYVQMGAYWGDGDITEDISDQDRHRLWEICRSLKWEYVRNISMYTDSGLIKINIDTIFGHSKLLWFKDIMEISNVKNYFGPVDSAVQLDEHWFYVRMDDGSIF